MGGASGGIIVKDGRAVGLPAHVARQRSFWIELGLADQWRRACNSVALNLAEGVGRRGSKEFRRFADIARGSLVEVEATIDLVEHLGHFTGDELEEVKAVRDECAKTVYGLLRKLSAVAASG